MTETFINETYGINGITRISLKKIIEVFSFPNEININFSNKKKSDFKYSEDKYTGRYLFDNENIDIFFQKYRNKKIVDGIMISLPYEDILPENKEVLKEIKDIIEIKNKIDNFFWK